jgi:hypothetical protein
MADDSKTVMAKTLPGIDVKTDRVIGAESAIIPAAALYSISGMNIHLIGIACSSTHIQ